MLNTFCFCDWCYVWPNALYHISPLITANSLGNLHKTFLNLRFIKVSSVWKLRDFTIWPSFQENRIFPYVKTKTHICFRYLHSTIPLRNFKSLAIFSCCTALFVSDLVGNPRTSFLRTSPIWEKWSANYSTHHVHYIEGSYERNEVQTIPPTMFTI